MRILLSTFGSFGDVHPYLAIALELKQRGHVPVLATSELYRAKIEAEGIEFFPIRPDLPPPETASEIIDKAMDGARGPQYLFDHILMPHLRASYDDMLRAVQGADVFFSHTLPTVAPLVAEKTGVPWISSVLAPLTFFSIHDVSVPPIAAPLFPLVRNLPPTILAFLFKIGQRQADQWMQPVYQLRAELGLPHGKNPILEGQHSPRKVLALFSSALAAPQADWPRNTVQTGFCFYDKRGEMPHAPLTTGKSAFELEEFLNNGEAPIVFTLGSSAVHTKDAMQFYTESCKAANCLNRRAVLLTGGASYFDKGIGKNVIECAYAPYSQLFPRACAIVHQGGVGTTAQAMRAGKPMLIMPFSHDQPDHAYRVTQQGIGRQISRKKYHAERVAQELKFLLDDSTYASRAAQIGAQIQREIGTKKAADEIENCL